ncbi:MAG: calcium/sodium antiporter [Thermoplasmata archaeon]
MTIELLMWTCALVAGVIILVKGADIMVDGGARTAVYLGVPAIIIGLTVVSFGTSLPELASSLNALSKGKDGISVGNVIGSNIANVLLVLGVSSIISPISVDKKLMKRELPIVFLAMALLIFFSTGIGISPLEGSILVIVFALYMGYFIHTAIKSDERKLVRERIVRNQRHGVTDLFPKRDITKIIVGICGIIIGSELMIRGGIFYAGHFNLSEGLIGLSIIAIGTSLPELAASGMAAYKNEPSISVGNVIGSNIFNILLVLGVCALITPLTFSYELYISVLIMIFVTVIIVFFSFTGRVLSRFQGGLMVLGYGLYMVYLCIPF